ncbi:MAG: hypothetical protein MUP52_08375 [Candidatus Aminicenantes bacterium]|nr:hypothetical protein [Candidatus Aminicenantes bacterium]
MKEQINDLEILEKKLREEIEFLEAHLSVSRKKLDAVTITIELLRKNGTYEQNKLFPIQQIISDKYKNIGMRAAIEDILKSSERKKMSALNIISELIKYGFQSKSKNLKRDVYTRLFRLEKRGILSSRKEGGLKKYFWKEEKIEEDTKKEKGETTIVSP